MSAAAVAFFVSFLLLQAKMKGHNASQGETGTAPAARAEQSLMALMPGRHILFRKRTQKLY
ncbi:hypothetical protein [Carboxylicivirga sediminis]|uniref:hypothetical protein n=1 Tax=Carboxylicivirga sediminis TaxID=2006564 RepID=UPI001BA4F981|nr:hypothetical protein [Carboxylicivirga sediminis]